MALDKDGNMDIDKTVDGIVDEMLPPTEELGEEKIESQEPLEPQKDVPTPEGEDTPTPQGDPVKDEGSPELSVAPKSWSKEMAPHFEKLAPEVKTYLAKREEDYTNGISQYKQAADYGHAIANVIAPYHAHIASRGVDVPTALKFLLNADYVLTTQGPQEKANLIVKLINDYKIDRALLGDQPVAKDPSIEALEKRLAKSEGTLTQFQHEQLESNRTKVQKAVDTFAANPKNVYFNELSDDIVRLINAGYTLEDAYEKAVWANPLTRAKEQGRLDKEKSEASKKAASEAAAKAKKASRSNVKDTPSGRASSTNLLGSMDDTLRATLRTINERT